MIRVMILCLLSLSLLACANRHIAPTPPTRSYVVASELQQGKRFFTDGYYKRAMRVLLPLACDGSPEAQYAVGYMYYYGLGVAQDTEVGFFWISRAASRNFYPAIKALESIEHPYDHSKDKPSPI